ncbi:hypothetical protein MAIC_27600 [Mycolicibacterium aichiense]|uniref:Uncharacterized protein n=1 Tax=Mycolicibacterium aichiense TaxID=1799 RepID=A0AAD1HM79_9MYCO|nr:hypothetical protein MAIC_27600 [Mycolicibacterium aichiense]
MTTGAAVSVEPVTATLPVAPDNVHSGVPAPAGGVVGHVVSGPAAWVTVAETAGAVDDLLADGVVSEPQAARVTANAAVQAPNATTEGRREKFTLVTLQRIDSAKVLAHTELFLSKASDGVGKLLSGALRRRWFLSRESETQRNGLQVTTVAPGKPLPVAAERFCGTF